MRINPNNENTEPKVKINNTELVTKFRADGGGVLHIHPELKGDRGMTVAFKRKGSRIEIATAVTHRADCFTRKIGTKLAIEHFLAGKTVTLPFANDRGIASLRYAFIDLQY